MIAVVAASIRARRRPGAIAFVFFTELCWALLVATPVHAWVRSAWGAHPDGDAVLFRGSGRDLMMWLGQEDAGMPVTARTIMALLVVGMLVMQLPLAALIAGLAFSRDADVTDPSPTPRSRRALSTVAILRIGVGAWLPLAGLLALGSLAAILVIAGGVLASAAIDHGLTERVGDARAFTVHLVALAFFGALVAVIGVFVDLARAAVGREAGLSATKGIAHSGWSMMLRGLKIAFTTSRRGIGRAVLAWAWRAALGLVLVAIGYAAAGALGGKGGLALGLLFVVHQGVVLGRVALRASWLARALALVAPVQDTRDADAAEPQPQPQPQQQPQPQPQPPSELSAPRAT